MIRYIIVCCLLVLLNKAEAKTIQVCKSCPVKTIRAGILAASANDVLIISKGIYKEYNLEIKSLLQLSVLKMQ